VTVSAPVASVTVIRISPSVIGIIPGRITPVISISVSVWIPPAPTHVKAGIPPVVTHVNAGSPAPGIVVIPIHIGVVRRIVAAVVNIGMEPAQPGSISVVVIIVGIVIVVGNVGIPGLRVGILFAGLIVIPFLLIIIFVVGIVVLCLCLLLLLILFCGCILIRLSVFG
jgi:hypothetical protein